MTTSRTCSPNADSTPARRRSKSTARSVGSPAGPSSAPTPMRRLACSREPRRSGRRAVRAASPRPERCRDRIRPDRRDPTQVRRTQSPRCRASEDVPAARTRHGAPRDGRGDRSEARRDDRRVSKRHVANTLSPTRMEPLSRLGKVSTTTVPISTVCSPVEQRASSSRSNSHAVATPSGLTRS